MSDAGAPIVVSIPYNSPVGVRGSLDQLDRPLSDRERFLLLEYPTVYIIHYRESGRKGNQSGESLVYVGEKNDIEARTRQHRVYDVNQHKGNAWGVYSRSSVRACMSSDTATLISP